MPFFGSDATPRARDVGGLSTQNEADWQANRARARAQGRAACGSKRMGVCVDGTRAQQLRHMERRVPGTAGFVGRYLRQSSLGADEARAELVTFAAELSAPQRGDWDTL